MVTLESPEPRWQIQAPRRAAKVVASCCSLKCLKEGVGTIMSMGREGGNVEEGVGGDDKNMSEGK